MREASALWRRESPATARISPLSYSCLSPLSRSYARYSAYVYRCPECAGSPILRA
jgi:hypothetical protein